MLRSDEGVFVSRMFLCLLINIDTKTVKCNLFIFLLLYKIIASIQHYSIQIVCVLWVQKVCFVSILLIEVNLKCLRCSSLDSGTVDITAQLSTSPELCMCFTLKYLFSDEQRCLFRLTIWILICFSSLDTTRIKKQIYAQSSAAEPELRLKFSCVVITTFLMSSLF